MNFSPRNLCFLLLSLSILGWVIPARAQTEGQAQPIVRQSIRNDTSAPLRDLVREPKVPYEGEPREINPLGRLPKVSRQEGSITSDRLPAPSAPAPTPAPLRSFDGLGQINGFLPPDTVGDVGRMYYLQAVNTSYAVFEKPTGTIALGPFDTNDIWSGFGGICESNNNGDPIVLYDSANDQWMVSQFAFRTFGPTKTAHQCIAVSATDDPTGSWHRYDFPWSNTVLNDYPHFGIWPDGLYLAVNQFDLSTFAWRGQGVAAFEWDKMRKGSSALMVRFDLFATNPDYGAQIPVDWEGADSPPPAGRPSLFVEWEDADWYNPPLPADQFWFWQFDVDWTNPLNSTFGDGLDYDYVLATADVDPDLCNYDRDCIPQPAPATSASYLDTVSPRLMHRLAYRNMGSHEAIVGSHTVDADSTDHAGVHWFEVRDPFGSPFIQQENVWAPDADHRWMGSVAMDKNGNIALGYSVSSTSTFPSIRYTGRRAGDPLGTMRAEQAPFVGAGSQTSTSNRWGDYSSMNVDPVDDVTFWYTQEYYKASSTGGYSTGITAYAFDLLLGDGFESGDASAWSASVP